MTPGEAAELYWLQPLPVESFPGLAAGWLADGIDYDEVVSVAIGYSHDDMSEIRGRFVAALKKLGTWLPSPEAAERAFVKRLAKQLIDSPADLAKVARNLRSMIDFDHVTYSTHPAPTTDFMAMCWLHDGTEYDRNGGIDRLMRAAHAAAILDR